MNALEPLLKKLYTNSHRVTIQFTAFFLCVCVCQGGEKVHPKETYAAWPEVGS